MNVASFRVFLAVDTSILPKVAFIKLVHFIFPTFVTALNPITFPHIIILIPVRTSFFVILFAVFYIKFTVVILNRIFFINALF